MPMGLKIIFSSSDSRPATFLDDHIAEVEYLRAWDNAFLNGAVGDVNAVPGDHFVVIAENFIEAAQGLHMGIPETDFAVQRAGFVPVGFNVGKG